MTLIFAAAVSWAALALLVAGLCATAHRGDARPAESKAAPARRPETGDVPLPSAWSASSAARSEATLALLEAERAA